MKNKFMCKWLLLCLLWLLTSRVLAQDTTTQYFMGILDAPNLRYNELEVSPIQTSQIYRDLATRASLKPFAPYPSSQGRYSTCTAWASAYAARTILEARQKNWTDRRMITDNAFSPGFLYRLCEPSRYDCSGSYISSAMDKLQSVGVPKLEDFSQNCPSQLPSNLYGVARQFKIQGYRRLWADDVWGDKASPNQKITALKQSIANGNPVVIGMICPESFHSAREVWQPSEKPFSNGYGQHGRHALCVVGYDDSQYGGAFEIQNSWGSQWGNQGYIWIRYRDFLNFVYETYEIFSIGNPPAPKPSPTPSPKPNPEPNPEPKIEKIDLAGSLYFATDAGDEMAFSLKDKSVYRTKKSYVSGTRFRMYVSNNEPAYMYVLSSDESHEVQKIYPYAQVSAALPYKKNQIAIPDEEHHLRLNEKTGTDYLCFIYAKKPINIEQIRSNIEKNKSNLNWSNKVYNALGTEWIAAQYLNLDKSKISFKAIQQDKNIVVVILEISHI
jgi:Papain family cysteine protease/Domain of unknown function (DUF4384)